MSSLFDSRRNYSCPRSCLQSGSSRILVLVQILVLLAVLSLLLASTPGLSRSASAPLGIIESQTSETDVVTLCSPVPADTWNC